MGAVWLLAGASGCVADPSRAGCKMPEGTESATHTAPVPDSSTTDTTPACPTSIAITCELTVNELRQLCTVDVDPPQPVQVTYSRSDGASVIRTHASDLEASSHIVPLYFMAPDIDYTVSATSTSCPEGPTADTVVHTGIPPSFVGSWLEMTGTSTMGLVGTNLPCTEKNAVAVIYDTNTGDLVWYQSLDPDGMLTPQEMVRFTRYGTVMGETGVSVDEFDLTGAPLLRLVSGVDYFVGLDHDIERVGNTLYGLTLYYPKPLLNLEAVIFMDTTTGAEITRFLPEEHFDFPPDITGDFLHTNTVTVDDSGDLYLSYLGQTALVKVDGQVGAESFGTPRWIIEGQDGQLEGTLALDWSHVDGPDEFERPHSLSLRADGRILVLDDHNGRGLSIALDESAGTATVDAVFPTHDLCGYEAQGTAQEAGNGNVIVACWDPWVREYDSTTAELLWEAEVKCREPGIYGIYGAVRWYPLDGWN